MSKKLLDLDGLTRYDGKIKQVISDKQDTLVSGTNIKTINGNSILGSGNITVQTDEPASITDEEIGNLFEQDDLEARYVPQETIQEAINEEY